MKGGESDPCGSRRMDMQACPFGPLLTGIKIYHKFAEVWICRKFLEKSYTKGLP